ncbi:hypothetical protein [Asaia sp. As-1742]|uniref:hypothetical protein n=1 Tax=Asaia sp. As-1742 TaxID=2608325 RepID=UPI001423BF82|nr:hypothetical protein [Asaia sp. As-1742]NIE81434.1 hypothetical protein [Asaia sp. As-1742]
MAGSFLAGCAAGNIRSAPRRGPAPPPVAHALFDPYAPYASAPVIWKPTVAPRMQLGRPRDPVIEAGRPDYENAPWSINQQGKKAGTF